MGHGLIGWGVRWGRNRPSSLAQVGPARYEVSEERDEALVRDSSRGGRCKPGSSSAGISSGQRRAVVRPPPASPAQSPASPRVQEAAFGIGRHAQGSCRRNAVQDSICPTAWFGLALPRILAVLAVAVQTDSGMRDVRKFRTASSTGATGCAALAGPARLQRWPPTWFSLTIMRPPTCHPSPPLVTFAI